jgi:hypothetical protein
MSAQLSSLVRFKSATLNRITPDFINENNACLESPVAALACVTVRDPCDHTAIAAASGFVRIAAVTTA